MLDFLMNSLVFKHFKWKAILIKTAGIILYPSNNTNKTYLELKGSIEIHVRIGGRLH